MAAPGISTPQTYVGNRAQFVSIGRDDAVRIDNTTDPPTVSVNGLPATPTYAMFYAQMPPDNPDPIEVGGAFSFPRDGEAGGSVIARASDSEFRISIPGVYEVSWQFCVDSAAQTALAVVDEPPTDELRIPVPVVQRFTVVGRPTGQTHMSNRTLLRTHYPNALISVVNGNSSGSVSLTQFAGGIDPVTANIIIRRFD